MKRILFIISALCLFGCTDTVYHNLSIVRRVEMGPNAGEDVVTTSYDHPTNPGWRSDDARIIVPHGMFKVGDTIKICK